ncbi:HlyD family efflux transporter periplasmic adaptor subunit [Coleofasciculus sp. LEGE 07092]|nr:HlyD family efflux transporter periplasmic adaptor subunit [Coleofasciculus sp. LEGE 07081]MBE9128717.1 HlyD family efflux transporter periplasmic adaptor subunit [Coleofasciculus sp. LEGE 07081]MBE9151486.1 HlyD family efflux transporter periplasmic adaptor subunit [Coleofasciculus sp. LEGE 07092]
MGQKPGINDQLFSKSVPHWAKNSKAFYVAIALAVGGILATGAIAVYSLNRVQARSESESSSSSPIASPAIEAVTALGRLEPTGEVRTLSAPMSLEGTNVKELLVAEGDQVRANQVIAIMDNRDRLQAAVDLAKKQVEIAQANLERVKAGAKAGAIQAQQETINRLGKELEGEQKAQQTRINRLETQLTETTKAQEATIKAQQATINAQQATIRRLDAEKRNTEQDFARYEQLVSDGVISTSELENRRLRVETAIERLSEAQENLSQQQANLTQAEANKAQTLATIIEQLEEARVNRDKTIAVLEAQIKEEEARLEEIKEIRPVDIKQAEAEVESALAAVDQAQADLKSLAYVRAPVDGQILKVHASPGEAPTEADGIVELGQTDDMMVIAEVYESDISKVRLGQRVAMTSESQVFEEELRGNVSQIGRQIGKKDILNTDPAAAVDARVVEVKIRLTPEDSKRVSGLTNSKVIVKIFLESKAN